MRLSVFIGIFICLLNFFTACSSGKKEDQTKYSEAQDKLIIQTSEHYTQAPYPDWDSDTTNVQNLTREQFLDRVLPQVIQYAENEADSATFFNNAIALRYPDMAVFYLSENDQPYVVSYADEPEILFISKAIDKKNTFAVFYSDKEDKVYFYRLHQKQWKKVGDEKIRHNTPMGGIYLEELNGEPGAEIVLTTYPPNMNGNSWKELFVYKELEDKVKFAGTFSTDYTVDPENKTVQEVYEGSMYVSPRKTLYVWKNDMLIPDKTVIINVPDDWELNRKRVLEYFENPSLSYDPNEQQMKLVFKKEFDLEDDYEKKGWYLKYWENFFEK